MSGIRISEDEQQQRMRIRGARSALITLIGGFVSDEGKPSMTEWLFVLNQEVQEMIAYSLRFNWTARKRGEKDSDERR